MDPLLITDPAALAGLLAERGCRCTVESVELTGSTNSDLVARCRSGRPLQPLLRVAAHQSGGRGRLGRRWQTEPGQALLFSVALPLDAPPAAVPAVTLACGVALAEVCRQRGAAVTIKWPNDVWLDGRKLAGILSELAVDAQGQRSLVVGVGINLELDAAARATLGSPAAALAEVLPEAARPEFRAAWLADFGAALIAAIETYLAQGLAPFVERWAGLDAMRDRAVEIRQGETVLARGLARGIDQQGCLLLEAGGRLVPITGGDVSLRVAA